MEMESKDINLVNLASECRPMKFTDVVGQPYIQGVGRQIGSGRISGQGYILSGPKGCGKTSAARIIAKALNCPNIDKETGNQCCDCSSCKMIDDNNNPQVDEINAAANRGINEIKEKIKSMSFVVSKGYRVYIFDEIHMLTKDAFSVLLKPLEEHPDHVVFIGTTTNPESIPETIISRCPTIPVLPLTDEDLRELLNNVVSNGKKTDSLWEKVNEKDIEEAIITSQGSARQAITNLSGVLFHGVSSSDVMSNVENIVDCMNRNSVEGVLSSVSATLSEKTANPITVVTAIMDKLQKQVGTKESADDSLTAMRIVKLSEVLSDISGSSPKMIVSAKVASCVFPYGFGINDSVKSNAKPKPRNSVGRKNSDSPSPHNDRNDSLSDRKEVFKKAVRPNNGNKMIIGERTNIEDVFEHIIKSRSARESLTKRWRDVLDDPDKSDIFIQDGKLIIFVDRPDSNLESGMGNLVSDFVIKNKRGRM